MTLQEEPEVTRDLVESCRRTASESWTKVSEPLEEQIREHPRYSILAAILFDTHLHAGHRSAVVATAQAAAINRLRSFANCSIFAKLPIRRLGILRSSFEFES